MNKDPEPFWTDVNETDEVECAVGGEAEESITPQNPPQATSWQVQHQRQDEFDSGAEEFGWGQGSYAKEGGSVHSSDAFAGDPFSFDSPSSLHTLRRGRLNQLSLIELFFITTLAAVSIGIYIYVSPLIAMVGAGGLAVAAVVKWVGCSNIISGGLVGFSAAIGASYAIILIADLDLSLSLIVALAFPAIGYLIGACMAEFSKTDSF